MKKFGKSSRVHSQGVQKIFMAPIYGAHCAVIFATAQLSCLTYAMAALNLTVKQEKELNACWNSVYRKLFGFHKWESVKCCIYGLNRLDLHSIIKLRRVSFYRHMVFSDRPLLTDVFWCFFVDSQPSTDVLAVFRRHGDAVSDILSDFKLNAS